MKKITVEVYGFDELDNAAKEKARAWYREHALDYEWWESTYEDAENIGLKITSFDLGRRQEIEGEFVTGAYGCALNIQREHGKDCETYKTAEKYLADRAALYAKYPQDEAGDFIAYHEANDALEDLGKDFLKSLLQDYFVMLGKEYEYLLSDEQVDESIRANEYDFTKDGKRFTGK